MSERRNKYLPSIIFPSQQFFLENPSLDDPQIDLDLVALIVKRVKSQRARKARNTIVLILDLLHVQDQILPKDHVVHPNLLLKENPMDPDMIESTFHCLPLSICYSYLVPNHFVY